MGVRERKKRVNIRICHSQVRSAHNRLKSIPIGPVNEVIAVAAAYVVYSIVLVYLVGAVFNVCSIDRLVRQLGHLKIFNSNDPRPLARM